MQFDSVLTVKKEITKEAFLRKALIELAKASETPIDVVNSQFGEVRESVKEVMLVSAHVESDYSVSIGYDRTEQYQSTERKYVSKGSWYTCNGVRQWADHGGTYTVDCIKERTVTDWQSHSGHISGDATCAEMNGDTGTRINVDHILITIKEDSIVERGEAKVDNESFLKVQLRCEAEVESRINFPGDRHKNFDSNADITVKSVECYKLPFYEVEYTYRDKKYKVEGFACGELAVAADLPPNDINIEAVAKNDTKKSKAGKIAGWIAFASTYVFAWVMFAIGVYWTWFIPVVALAAAIVFHVLHNKKYSEKIRSLKEDNIKLKCNKLKDVLAEKGYDPLTEEESDCFDEKKGGAEYAARHKKGGVVGWAVLGGILTAALIITSLIGGANANKARLHSPEQVTIALVNKTQEYDPDASPYINGCYYIYLEYHIAAGEIGVDYIQFRTTVSDESGEELGSITTSLSTMNLDAGGEKSYETYLQENQPEKNQFFSSLYDAVYSDLSLEYEILSIGFSDGEYYHD